MIEVCNQAVGLRGERYLRVQRDGRWFYFTVPQELIDWICDRMPEAKFKEPT